MEEEFCEILRLRAVPHILSPDQNNVLLNLDGVIPTVYKEGIPLKLVRELEKQRSIIDQAEKVQFYTLTFQGNPLLETPQQWVTLELLPQPYVLYNASEGDQHKSSTITYAMYTVDSTFATETLESIEGQIKLNPENFNDSKVTTKIDMVNKKLTSNSRFRISTLLPVQVFYTLMFVEFKGRVVRVLVTRNNIILNDTGRIGSSFTRISLCNNYIERISNLAEIYVLLSNTIRKDYIGFDDNCFESLASELNGSNQLSIDYWKGKFKYFIWALSGKPVGDPNYGDNQYKHHFEKSWNESQGKVVFNWSTEFLNRCYDQILNLIFDYIKSI